jgi:PKD repeat protein
LQKHTFNHLNQKLNWYFYYIGFSIKKNENNNIRTLSLIFFVFLIVPCKDKIPSANANFNFTINKGEVTFSNQSINAETFQWDFGDGIGKSNEKDPKYKN